MKNAGFYDKNGLLIDVRDAGVSIEDLCNYASGLELYNPEYEHADLLYLILNNFNLRKKYLIEYNNKTDFLNDKLIINEFVRNFDKLSKKRKMLNAYTKDVNDLLNKPNEIGDLEFSKIREVYAIINNTYDQMINNKVPKDLALKYIDTLNNLVMVYHKIYNYDMNMDPKFQEMVDKFKHIGK